MMPNDDPSDFLFGGYERPTEPGDGDVMKGCVVGLCIVAALGIAVLAVLAGGIWAFAKGVF